MKEEKKWRGSVLISRPESNHDSIMKYIRKVLASQVCEITSGQEFKADYSENGFLTYSLTGKKKITIEWEEDKK